jgi:adenylate cyclase
MGNTNWPGVKAGLRLMDKIVALNERPIREGQDIVDIARGKSPGTLVHYTVESGEKLRKVSFPITKFSTIDFLIVFFLPFLGGLALLSIGFIVYILKPNVSTSWVFFFFCLVVSIYMVTGFEMQSTYRLVHLHYFVIPFQGAVLFHLGSIFPEKKQFLIHHPKFEYAIYLPTLILTFLFEMQLFTFLKAPMAGFLSWLPDVKTITAFSRIFILICVIGFIAFVVHSMYHTSSNVVRQRAKMIFFGVTLAFFPTVLVFLFVHFMKISFPFNFMIFFVLSFPASMAYSIVRHNLFDADTIIRRTVGYVVVTGVVVGAYIGVSILLNTFLEKYNVAQSSAFPIVFTVAIILIFNPLRNRIQSLVDRIFFRKEYDYGEIIDKISNAITSLLDLGQILKQVIRIFTEDMFIDTSSVMLLNPATDEYQVYLSDGEKKREVEKVILRRDQPLMQIIEREKKELTKYDVFEDPRFRTSCEDCAKDFETLNASLMVPLIFQDKVIGLLNLGEKKSGKFYNRGDIDLLRTLANQGAVAIENARLVNQMKSEELVRANLARYLSPQIVDQVIKKDVQVNLGGNRKVVTVLFSDIRNFTRISESLPPDKLVELLNEYFTEMAKIIFENQGSLDKYIGDAIVAVFGSLIPLENSAQTGVQAAVQMMKEMQALNEKWKGRYGFKMEMGIGINTGEVFLGNVGSPERMEFTVIGDTVNIASRFSGVAQGGQILVAKDTLFGLGPDIKYKELEPVEVKGKTGKLEVFEIVYR